MILVRHLLGAIFNSKPTTKGHFIIMNLKKITLLFAAALFGASAANATDTIDIELKEGYTTWNSAELSTEVCDEDSLEWTTLKTPWTNDSVAAISLAEGSAYLKIDNLNGGGYVCVAGIDFSGKGGLVLQEEELTVSEGGFISAASGSAGVTIDSSVNFVNGGTLSGVVDTSNSGTLKVSAGTLSAEEFYGTGVLHIAAGARAERTNIITSDYTFSQKLSGEGTLAVSTLSTSTSYTGTLAFSGTEAEDFKGTLKITSLTTSTPVIKLSHFSGTVDLSGGIDLLGADFDNAETIRCSGNGNFYGYASDFAGKLKEFSQVLEIEKDVTTEFYTVYFSTKWNGELRGEGTFCYQGCLSSYYQSDFTFTNKVSVSTIQLDWGILVLEGAASQIERFMGANFATTNSNYKKVFRIASDAVLNITGSADEATPYAGGFQVSRKGHQAITIDGVLNLQNDGISNVDGTGAIDVNGEMNFNVGLLVNDKNNDAGVIALNVNSGGRINIGSGGMTNAPSLTLNLNDGATIGSLASTWKCQRALALDGVVTIDTELRAFDPAGASTATGETSTVSLYKEVSGSGSLTKTGAGKLLLYAANSYTGGTTLEEGTLGVLISSALGNGGLRANGGEAIFSTVNSAPVTFSGASTLSVGSEAKMRIQKGTILISGNTFDADGAVEIREGGRLELSGGKVEIGGTFSNAGTLNIIAQQDGVNSGVTIGDGATFTNSGTILISAGTLAQGESVTVFADASGAGVLDSTGIVQGTGNIKVFGGYYENGVFTAGEKKQTSAGDIFGEDGKLSAGMSVKITDSSRNAVILSASAYVTITKVENLDQKTIRFKGQEVEIGASWSFGIDKEESTEVLVTMNIGKGMSLDDIQIFHKEHEDGAEWEDFTGIVGNLTYDIATGDLSFTTKQFSSYAVTGIYSGGNIPEPSQFGIFAGAGALALSFLSRRRRRKNG